LRQILWGLFKKIVIADNCAIHANLIFDQYETLSAPALVLGALLFAFQIYGDFSGYSDIALGTARLFGIELLRNFAYPYFSRDIAEFWRRWHISLSTWFRDYLYIPLGGSKGGLGKKVRNTFIIFLVSGFWHGSNWTFIVWGGLNALFFLPLLLSDRNRSNLDVVAHDRLLPKGKEFFQLISTFLLTSLAWIFFRAESVSHAAGYLKGFFIQPWSIPAFKGVEMLPALAVLLVLFFSIEWIGRRHDHPLKEWQTIRQRSVRWGLYILLVFLIGLFMPAEESPFIYFQF
jgi:D-alanyl-lipoteichoic acid acyltransferase DltB (MBOAT superfamily)